MDRVEEVRFSDYRNVQGRPAAFHIQTSMTLPIGALASDIQFSSVGFNTGATVRQNVLLPGMKKDRQRQICREELRHRQTRTNTVFGTDRCQGEFVAAWKGLQPYRVAVPVESDPLSAELLYSNFKVALAILEARLNAAPEAPGASPRPSPGR